MSYDIRMEIATFLDVTDLTEPRAIANVLASEVPSRELRATLAEAMVSLVRDVIRARRNLRPIPEVQAPGKLSDGSAMGVRRPAKSTKRDLIAQAHEKRLRDLMYIGKGKRLQLGECTYENLMFIAEEYRGRAATNMSKAKQYEKLAAALDEYKALNVRELPVHVFEELMS